MSSGYQGWACPAYVAGRDSRMSEPQRSTVITGLDLTQVIYI
jgi:hypothetical protein